MVDAPNSLPCVRVDEVHVDFAAIGAETRVEEDGSRERRPACGRVAAVSRALESEGRATGGAA